MEFTIISLAKKRTTVNDFLEEKEATFRKIYYNFHGSDGFNANISFLMTW